MIVRYKEEGWEVITQRAHGLLSFQIARHWGMEHPRWSELMLAIAEHDDAEVELDGENLLTSNGGPLNYEMKTFSLDNCQRLSDLSVTKSRYIALLTSMHMHFLYEKDAKTDEQAKTFLDAEKSKRTSLMRGLKISAGELEKDYALLQWCDAISLLLCRDDMQPEHRRVEISKGPDGTDYFLKELTDGVLTVDPWPFDVKEFDASIEYRMTSKLSFRSSAEFRKAFYEAEVLERKWKFSKDTK